jgi:DNA helicase II / ATP-dependent DNA helicase PcrA
MNSTPLESALLKLNEAQLSAVNWEQGSLLVLAGPGSGKTQVLTCRIARLINSSQAQNFRILALTFTTKAADEMRQRVASLIPGLEERANIGTFHSFCAQVLRQHGVHVGIKPDFAIYSADEDRREILTDALKGEPDTPGSADCSKYLALIDRLKARLVLPENAEVALSKFEDRTRIVTAYRRYEEALSRLNALDFNSLILQVHRLMTMFPAIALRYHKTYPYWLIDEFQDTNIAQYTLLRVFAGGTFRNMFAVADDDQIIYEWNGASYRQIQSFVSDFRSQLLQLPTNYRCPPSIVAAANHLVVYNAHRTSSKQPLVSGKIEPKLPAGEQIQLRVYEGDDEEAAKVADEILNRGKNIWGQTAVIARTRALVERMHKELAERHVPSFVAQRRDDFLSPEFRWLVSILRQSIRPLDARNFQGLSEAFNRLAGTEIAADQVLADAQATGHHYLKVWIEAAKSSELGASHKACVDLVEQLLNTPLNTKQIVEALLAEFKKSLASDVENNDLLEDLAAWGGLTREIAGQIGRNAPLEQFLQELQMRSKEPAPKAGTVTLMTIHGAKGREFDFVYVIGLAEDILPSYQSKQKGDQSPEMEEERRNCFVAITRAKECLVLSRAKRYRGWQKEPSRFLVEMQMV